MDSNKWILINEIAWNKKLFFHIKGIINRVYIQPWIAASNGQNIPWIEYNKPQIIQKNEKDNEFDK